jgi:PAS domain-containing protein
VTQDFDPTSLVAALTQIHDGTVMESVLDAVDHDSGLAISLRDADGRLVYLNDGTRQIFGLGDITVAGRVSVSGSRYFLPGGREIPLIDHPAQVAARSGLPQVNVVFAIERPGDHRRWLRMTFLPIQRSERGWSVLGIGCDVTDLYDGGRSQASGSGTL